MIPGLGWRQLRVEGVKVTTAGGRFRQGLRGEKKLEFYGCTREPTDDPYTLVAQPGGWSRQNASLTAGAREDPESLPGGLHRGRRFLGFEFASKQDGEGGVNTWGAARGSSFSRRQSPVAENQIMKLKGWRKGSKSNDVMRGLEMGLDWRKSIDR